MTPDPAAIRKRAEKATPGPWELWGDDDEMVGVVVCEMWPTKVKVARSNAIVPFANTPDVLDNAEFIAHAREDVPALCDALKSACAALREIAEYGGGDGGDWVECCNIARAALGDVP